jgi:hypothetical protein
MMAGVRLLAHAALGLGAGRSPRAQSTWAQRFVHGQELSPATRVASWRSRLAARSSLLDVSSGQSSLGSVGPRLGVGRKRSLRSPTFSGFCGT